MSVPARLLERELSSVPPVRARPDQVFSRAAGAALIGDNEVERALSTSPRGGRARFRMERDDASRQDGRR